MAIKNRSTLIRVFSRKYAYSTCFLGTGGVSGKAFMTIQGAIAVSFLGIEVLVATPSTANTLCFTYTSAYGTSTALCTAVSTASATANDLFYVPGPVASALTKNTANGLLASAQLAGTAGYLGSGGYIVMTSGYIAMTWTATSALASGQIKVMCQWEPLAIDTIIPAEGY